MATTLSSATMTVRVIESIKLNGTEQGAVNTRTISSINEISKRILTVPTSETVVTSFSTAVATGTFIEGDVRYIRITNKDDTNFVYLVFKNEYSNEFCVKLDSGQSYIYNGDNNSGVIDTMLANQVPFGFTEATGDTADSSDDVTNITASSGSTSVYLDIGGEEVYVKSKDTDSNKITVKRGQDGTTKLAHIRGTEVKSITSTDNALVEEGDDFGFSGTSTWNG